MQSELSNSLSFRATRNRAPYDNAEGQGARSAHLVPSNGNASVREHRWLATRSRCSAASSLNRPSCEAECGIVPLQRRSVVKATSQKVTSRRTGINSLVGLTSCLEFARVPRSRRTR